MQLNEFKPKTKKRKVKRIGRGGKRGSFSGRGTKGQKARAGRRIRPEMRDIIKKIPKARGYAFASINKKPFIINLAALDKNFKENEKVTPQTLLEKGLIKKKGNVKILSDGNVTKSFVVFHCQISKQAREKIEKAGGTIS
jgi:large subunit ribosomal protein L15